MRRPTGHYPVCQRASPFLTVYTIAAIGYVQIKDKTGGPAAVWKKIPFLQSVLLHNFTPVNWEEGGRETEITIQLAHVWSCHLMS